SRRVAKATTAVTLGGSLMVLSGLTLVGTVIALVLATPLLVIFSPVLVPAAIAVLLIVGGFVASGGFGAIASFVLYWMYKYTTGKHPTGASELDRFRDRMGHFAHDAKEQ
ncbi:oleosin, partial [Genlisea aurea]